MLKIVSGGQTGVDQAALDVACKLDLDIGGWCPRGRKAENGVIPAHYPLRETPSDDYSERTEWNVRDSDATLILTWGIPIGGTEHTLNCVKALGRTFLQIDITTDPKPEIIIDWIRQHGIRVLNVAGPRESFKPGAVYSKRMNCF